MVSYEDLKFGNKKQQKAYVAIRNLHIMKDFVEYNTTLCGTIPISIDLDDSDLDIIMEVHNFDRFEEKVTKLYGDQLNFRVKSTNIRGRKAVKANFVCMDFEFELFGQKQPVYEQYAYLHMMIEHAVLNENPSLREKVIKLKENGYKTEPAFCELLGIEGDPYDGLIRHGMDQGII